MRIHVVGINYWPEATGIAVFTTGRAEYLASLGHQVTMCAAVPYYPQWQVPLAYRRLKTAREIRAGVTILRCPLYVPTAVTTIRRVLHEASFVAAALLRSLPCRRPDLVFVVSPPLGLAVVAVILSRFWRVPYVFHVADLQPDTALDLGMMRAGRIARLLYAVERLAYRKAALVSTLTGAMRARIIAKGIAPAKVALFSDWAEPELFDLAARADSIATRRELGLGDAFIVLHAGNMGVKQGLGVVLDAAERTRSNPDVIYVLVGDGAMRPSLEAGARERSLPNVRFVPIQARDRFLHLLAAADVCLVTQQRTVADIVFPSKVLTLLAAGKPVVASVAEGSEVARVIRSAGAGTVVAPENADLLADAVEGLRGNASLRLAMGAAGRAYARTHWERAETLKTLAQTLEGLAGAAPAVTAGAVLGAPRPPL